MAFKMKGSPYGGKRNGEMDMKSRMSKNFDKSGMNNADGSPVKPGAPGFFGNLIKGKGALGLLNPLGAIMSRMKKKKAAGAAEAGADTAAAAVPPPAVGAPPVDPDLAAGPVAPAAGAVDPNAQVDPNAAPMQMKASPAKDIKSWTAAEMNKPGSKWVAKDIHNDKHRRKEVDSDHKAIKKVKKDKGGAPMKASPAKGMWDDFKKSVKSTSSKVYDKASQIGMGLKAAGKEISRKIDPSDFGRDIKTPWENAKRGFEKEKKADDAAIARKAKGKKPKVKTPTMEQNIKNVKKMQERKVALAKFNKANPKIKQKY